MTDAATAAARQRVADLMSRAQHVQLTSLILGKAGPAIYDARERAMAAAAEAGRLELVDEARRDATTWVLQAFARRGYSGTWAATEVAMSVARPADRTAVAEALADAVTAAVVEDLVDTDPLDALRSTWETLDASSAIPEPGVLSGLTASLTRSRGRPGWGRLGAAAVVFLLGLLYLAGANPLGLVLMLAAAVVLTNSLRGRPN